MPERTAEDWAEYIAAAIKAAEDDGYVIDNEIDECGSACCTCETGGLTVSKWHADRRTYEEKKVEW
jgi:hypothetical protein